MDSLRMGTVVPAALMGLSEDVGTIESGKYADIVATAEDPLDNIEALARITFVMKEGVVYVDDTTVN